jgi:hypothetical protein
LRRELERIRRLRNAVVHGVETPEPETLRDATESLQRILERLKGLVDTSSDG